MAGAFTPSMVEEFGKKLGGIKSSNPPSKDQELIRTLQGQVLANTRKAGKNAAVDLAGETSIAGINFDKRTDTGGSTSPVEYSPGAATLEKIAAGATASYTEPEPPQPSRKVPAQTRKRNTSRPPATPPRDFSVNPGIPKKEALLPAPRKLRAAKFQVPSIGINTPSFGIDESKAKRPGWVDTQREKQDMASFAKKPAASASSSVNVPSFGIDESKAKRPVWMDSQQEKQKMDRFSKGNVASGNWVPRDFSGENAFRSRVKSAVAFSGGGSKGSKWSGTDMQKKALTQLYGTPDIAKAVAHVMNSKGIDPESAIMHILERIPRNDQSIPNLEDA